jgi:5S rRNA maturation endonuclease (ribonuclease M5)
MKQKQSFQATEEKLNIISRLCSDRIEDLLEKLEVDAHISGNKYVGVCPIHGESDNPLALNIYYDGYDVPGYWKCRTRFCQNKFKPTIIGFTRGRLSSLRMGYHWKKKPDAIFGFPGTIEYLCNFLELDINDIKVDPKEEDRRKFMAECVQTLNNNKLYVQNESTIHRKKVKKNLIIPSQYFINRGFPANILEKYDIGLARKSKTETQNRIIVPIYNDDEYLIGYTCRSIFEKCIKCKLFHNPDDNCPSTEYERNLCSKWRHVGFNSEQNLYNYWKAKNFIKNTNTAILVEGPADVWRLEQYDVHNSVAMFGHTLYDAQERLLANAQCMAIIVLTDNDQAGIEGAKEIKRKYGRLYNLYFPNINTKDAGEMNENDITDNVKPFIEAAKRYI